MSDEGTVYPLVGGPYDGTTEPRKKIIGGYSEAFTLDTEGHSHRYVFDADAECWRYDRAFKVYRIYDTELQELIDIIPHFQKAMMGLESRRLRKMFERCYEILRLVAWAYKPPDKKG